MRDYEIKLFKGEGWEGRFHGSLYVTRGFCITI